MQTRVMHYILCVCLICAAGSLIAAPQDKPTLKEMKDSYYPVLLAPQDGPEVKKRVNPWYPTILKAAGIEGEAFVKVFIDEQGKVEKAEILKSTHEAFSEAAIEAAKQWEFSPAVKDGKPIKAEVTVPFRFKLAEGSLKSKNEDLLRLQQDVFKLLRGEGVDSMKSHILPDAYAVVGNKYEHLSSLFSEKAKSHWLIEGRDSKVEWSHSVLSDAGDMAYLVFKTRPAAGKAERYHTVVFVKASDGKWTISAWHTGA
jgi:TonB family protein